MLRSFVNHKCKKHGYEIRQRDHLFFKKEACLGPILGRQVFIVRIFLSDVYLLQEKNFKTHSSGEKAPHWKPSPRAICACSLGIRERIVQWHMIALTTSDPPARTLNNIHLITCPEITAEVAASWSDTGNQVPAPSVGDEKRDHTEDWLKPGASVTLILRTPGIFFCLISF